MKKLNQWIDRFAYSHPRFGIPNLMLYIVIANAVTYILTLFAGSAALSFLKFDLYHVLHGEVWRLVTFVLLPFTYYLEPFAAVFARKDARVSDGIRGSRTMLNTSGLAEVVISPATIM